MYGKILEGGRSQKIVGGRERWLGGGVRQNISNF